jgi:prophage regulatory protein
MTKTNSKKQLFASTVCVGCSNPEPNLPSVSEARRSGHLAVPGALPAGSAASYLIGLDDKPGAALLAASVRDVLVRIGDVCTISGLSIPTIYRLMTKGLFPRPVKITTTARAWKLSELTTWIETRERGGSL